MKWREGEGSHASKCELHGLAGGSTKTKAKEIGSIDKLRSNDGEGRPMGRLRE